MVALIDRLMKRFKGMQNAYGIYDLSVIKMEGKKKKGVGKTIQAPVTKALWQKHLDGIEGIGIVPIDENSQCYWGCIDIDDYEVDFKVLMKKIFSLHLPLLCCKSKSEGAQLFAFFDEPIAADIVQDKLKHMAAKLGYSGVEIFPKQCKILVERGDFGSWLNMPYYNMGKESRYAIGLGDENIVKYSLEQFLDLTDAVALTLKDLNKIVFDVKDVRFKEAPPCMQCIIEQGVPDGLRNITLYSFGILAKKMFPEGWQNELDRWNQEFCDPPLPASELAQIQRNLEKKDYKYKCNEQPLAGYCNAGICRIRKYGSDSDNIMPQLNSLTKLESDPPIWFVNAESGRLELSTDELQDQRKFQKKCMEILNIMPPKVKEPQWQQIIASLLENVTIVEQPTDVGVKGHFMSLLEEFTTRSIGRTRDEILMNKPWYDQDNNKVLFQLKDLVRFLDRNKFREYVQGQITTRLKELQGGSIQMKIKGVKKNIWFIPAFEQQSESFDLPNFEDTPF